MENSVWLQNYPAGVPANIDPDQYPNLLTFIDEQLKKYKNLPAFECFGKRITYGAVDKLSDQFAGYLQYRGLKPNDKIAIMMPNLLQFPIALFGAMKAGLVVVNTNPLYTAREMKHQFTDSDVKAIVIAENFAHNLEKILGDTSIDLVIKTSIGEMLGTIKGCLINFVVRRIKKGVPKFNIPNAVDFTKAVKEGKNHQMKAFENTPHRVIVHQYTGGTTGVSKGAMLTNRNLISNMLQMRTWLGGKMEEKDIALCPLPLYHIFAFSVNLLAMMSYGALSVLVTNPRDLDKLVKEFKKNDITALTGVNTLFNALNNHDEFPKLDFSKLKAAMGGGTAVQKPVAIAWEKITGLRLVEGYGMTEASPVVTANPFNGNARIGTIGMPIPSTIVRIVKEDGTVGGVNEVGEIQVKGPQVMKGYFNKPEETAQTIVDGWLLTGDIGLMEEDGYFRIVDRKKDMILVSGFNVYPNEIEDVVVTHDKVMEAAVVGIPDERTGEKVKLYVVKGDKSLTEEELVSYCRENLTGYKIPKEVEFRTELPKTNVGKILRRVLRDENL